MKGEMIVTSTDYQRLTDVVELSAAKTRMPELVKALLDKLAKARVVPQHEINDGIVTMNSKVYLRDTKSGRETEVTITYPQEADPRQRRVSIFSEVGLALLGKGERDIVSWKVPGGIGEFEVVRVTYQPEAAGHFNL